MLKLTIKKRVGRILAVFLRMLFRIAQRFGIHIVRNHFYEPVPDTRNLHDGLWNADSDLVGLDMNVESQIALTKEVFPVYIGECNFSAQREAQPHEFYLGNGLFESVDAEVLHCFVRHFKPKKILEIGSGYSTLISAKAATINAEKDGCGTQVIAIEPYPHSVIAHGFPGLTKLVTKRVEQVGMDLFRGLDKDDILFIDSSHVVKIGNDVLYEYLEVLPRLKPGVLVHIHDIFLPAGYPEHWVMNEHIFWTEQYLLQAFLAFNEAFEVVWASSYMSIKFKDILENTFPSWRNSYLNLPKSLSRAATRDGNNVWPVSIWIRKIK